MAGTKRRWRHVRRLHEMQTRAIALVSKAANKRKFLVIKQEESLMALPSLEAVVQVRDIMTRAVEVLKAGQLDEVATQALQGEFDKALDLVSPQQSAGENPMNKLLLDGMASVLKDLGNITLEVQTKDMGLADRLDSLKEQITSWKNPLTTATVAAEPKVEDKPADAPAATAPVIPAAPPVAEDVQAQQKAAEDSSTKPEDKQAEVAPTQAPAPAETPSAEEIITAETEVASVYDIPAEEAPMAEAAPAEVGEIAVEVDVTKGLPAAGKPGGSKKPPKGYPKEKAQYADPENYKYPIDTPAHVKAAVSYFSKKKNYSAYSASEQKSVWSRIKSAAKKAKVEVAEDSGPPTVQVAKAEETAVITRQDILDLGQTILTGFKEALKEVVVQKQATPPVTPFSTLVVPSSAGLQPVQSVTKKDEEDDDYMAKFDLTMSKKLQKIDARGMLKP